jgi:uncharacterized protein (TIGR02001 family)
MTRVPGSAAKGMGALSALLLFGLGAAAQAGSLGDMFDVAFGAAVTNDYISRGISQTSGDPAVQGYVEANYSIVYAGVWASNVDFGTPDAEIDVYAGIRPETDIAAFDLGYVHYFYAAETAPDYGEIYGLAELYATDSFTLGANLYFAPDYSRLGGTAVFVEGTVDYALPANFGVSGGLGYQGFDASLGLPDYWTWNAGIYWTFADTVTVDLRYIDSDLSKADCGLLMSRRACGARFMATLSLDTALSAFAPN